MAAVSVKWSLNIPSYPGTAEEQVNVSVTET